METSDLRYAEPDDPDVAFGFLVAEIVWAPGRYDQLLRDVADDRTPSVVFFSLSGFAYSPYDGGADIITPRQTDVARLRAKWKAWLSSHPEDL